MGPEENIRRSYPDPPGDGAAARRAAFTAACGFVMPFGKYAGKTLARIGASNEGLKYLDWLIGAKRRDTDVPAGAEGMKRRETDDLIVQPGPLRDAIETYLRHPGVSMSLNALLGD
jgi:uncharacterized protein (DUF3820 family)